MSFDTKENIKEFELSRCIEYPFIPANVTIKKFEEFVFTWIKERISSCANTLFREGIKHNLKHMQIEFWSAEEQFEVFNLYSVETLLRYYIDIDDSIHPSVDIIHITKDKTSYLCQHGMLNPVLWYRIKFYISDDIENSTIYILDETDKEIARYLNSPTPPVQKIISNMSYNVNPAIKNVIFNDPATIVFWMDGSKTVVKCEKGKTFDPEKGLAMAIVKKYMGLKEFFKALEPATKKRWDIMTDVYTREVLK